MSGRSIERRDRWIGRVEAEGFTPIFKLADALYRADFRHWDTAFQHADWGSYWSSYSPDLLAQVRSYEAKFDAHQVWYAGKREHSVEMVFSPSKNGLLLIDNFKFVFVDDSVDASMYTLLSRKTIRDRDFELMGTTVRAVEKDLRFLNDYFGLGLQLQSQNVIGRYTAYKLAIPPTTRVFTLVR